MNWDKAKDSTLAYYWRSPMPAAEIGKLFGVSYEAVRARAYKLKLGRKTIPKRVWKPELCDKFRLAWQRGRTCADVAKAMGLTEGACYAQAAAMRLPFRTRTGPRRGAKPTVWTSEDRTRALELWDLGLSASKIGLQLGRSRNSVIGAIHRHRLGSIKNESNFVPRAAG